MGKKPIDEHYNPQGGLRLLAALVKVLIMVMILGISIIVGIIVKEFFFEAENKIIKTIVPETLSIPKDSKVDSIYFKEDSLYLVISTKNRSQEILIIELEDGLEISRESVKILKAD